MSKLALFLLLLFPARFFNPADTGQVTGQQLVSDFNILVTSLEEMHPRLYTNISKAEFDADVAHIRERLQHTTSKFEAIYMMQELTYKIGSAHVGNISIYNDLGVTKVLPFSVYIIDHELYVKRYAADTTYNGEKIVAIEGTPARELIDSLVIFFPRDGNRDIVSGHLQRYFNGMYSAFCGEKDTFHVQTARGMLAAPAAIRGSALFEGLVLKTYAAYFGKYELSHKELTDEYGYFKFDGFVPKKKIEESYSDFLEEVDKKQVRNIVIDLRTNPGGLSDMAAKMATFLADKPFRMFEDQYYSSCKIPTWLKYMDSHTYYRTRNFKSTREDSLRRIVRFDHYDRLRQPAKSRFTGHIYIITSSLTQSSSTIFCKYLMDQPNVTFVGEETSGAVNYIWAGHICQLTLPNMKTVFAFGDELLELKGGSSKTEKQVGIVPDHKIVYTIEERLSGIDKEMDFIRNAIKTRKP